MRADLTRYSIESMRFGPKLILQGFAMCAALILSFITTAGCNVLPKELPPPLPAPPTGDTLLIFGEEVPSTPEAIREAIARRVPPGTPHAEVVDRMAAEGFFVGQKDRRDGRWVYTFSGPRLMTSRWGMVQDVRVRLTEEGGPEAATVGEVQRLPESKMLESCPALRRLPGMPRAEAEAFLRENGFTVRETTMGWVKRYTVLYARKWGEPSPHSPCAMLVCRIEDGRIATVSPATDSHPARGFNGLVGMFPSRNAPAAEQVRAYALIPVWTAEVMGLGLLQWMCLPFSL